MVTTTSCRDSTGGTHVPGCCAWSLRKADSTRRTHVPGCCAGHPEKLQKQHWRDTCARMLRRSPRKADSTGGTHVRMSCSFEKLQNNTGAHSGGTHVPGCKADHPEKLQNKVACWLWFGLGLVGFVLVWIGLGLVGLGWLGIGIGIGIKKINTKTPEIQHPDTKKFGARAPRNVAPGCRILGENRAHFLPTTFV